MNISVPLILLILLIIKHLVCDFLLQSPYQYLNKGKAGHPGGLLHAGINGAGTMIALSIACPALGFPVLIAFGVFDYVSHYFIDYAKVRINEYNGWKPENSAEYWISLGLDQTLHWIVYALILYNVVALGTIGDTVVISTIISIIGCGVVMLFTSKTRDTSNTTGVH